ncbi:uncharacterized protein [Rutidosis leptorrhynchoides]|uniref:uncharacterized protein n=1 Tax=Rutidosis leptorrhynchoides TaxID=125765 RepID=UPI003A99485A
MKVLSLNVRGFAISGKFGWVRNLCVRERPCVATFQETKCNAIDDKWINALWGGSNFGYIQKEASSSGGLITFWDPSVFDVSDCSGCDFFVAIKGKWVVSGVETTIVNVYDPHNDREKILFWELLDRLINGMATSWLIVGDFNEDDLSVIALDRHLSDHCPLILRDKVIDYGPKPFKVFDEWFNYEEVDKSTSKFGGLDREIDDLNKEVLEWELKAEANNITNSEREKWLDCRRRWGEKTKTKANMLKQKARLKWTLEGDENTKFFHAMIRRKNTKCNFRGLNINGAWVEDPTMLKDSIFKRFSCIFTSNPRPRPSFLPKDTIGPVQASGPAPGHVFISAFSSHVRLIGLTVSQPNGPLHSVSVTRPAGQSTASPQQFCSGVF